MAQGRTKSSAWAAARPRARRDASRRLLALGVLAIAVVVMIATGWPLTILSPNAAEPLTRAEARASNAAVPIDRSRRRRAERYRFRSGPAAARQAVECLAAAALYEAGDDPRGQEAVIQVILNRVRARGFPKTICGVVYQGSARTTGCQFTFTCDGSLQRRPVHLGWAAARRTARQALAGHVYAPVGRATHYHSDWVVPYWRDSMVKIARVGTHLFYVRT